MSLRFGRNGESRLGKKSTPPLSSGLTRESNHDYRLPDDG